MPRPRTPTHLKLVTGNPGKRALPKGEPQPPAADRIPAPPAWLTKRAALAWRRIAPVLHGMGVLTVADRLALERLCECYADIMEARASYEQDQVIIDTDGERTVTLAAGGVPTYITHGKAGSMLRTRPELAAISDADRRFRAYLNEFGMTPAARSKVTAAPPGKGEAPDRFFG